MSPRFSHPSLGLLGLVMVVVVALLSSASLTSAQDPPNPPGQLMAWKVSGCEPIPKGFPNSTMNCPYSTPTTLTVEGAGFLPYAPNNFTVCLMGPNPVTAPGHIIDDGHLTFTTSEQFYLDAGAQQWGTTALYLAIGAGMDFDCQSIVIRMFITAVFPSPQLTSVSGCVGSGLATLDCAVSDDLILRGSGFTTFAVPFYGVGLVFDGATQFGGGQIVDDTTIVVKGGWYWGISPPALTEVAVSLVFNLNQLTGVTSQGNVIVSWLPTSNSTNTSSTSTRGVYPTSGSTGGADVFSTSSSALSTGGVVGIIVAVMLAVVCLALAVYYRVVYKSAQGKTGASETMMSSGRYQNSSNWVSDATPAA
jgi:hypothetical protein